MDSKLFSLDGYPIAIAEGEVPSYQDSIEVKDIDDDATAIEIEHRGDSSEENSGGPFWAWFRDKKDEIDWDEFDLLDPSTWEEAIFDPNPYIVGTHSGGHTEIKGIGFIGWTWEDKYNLAAGGSALPDLIRWAKNNI